MRWRSSPAYLSGRGDTKTARGHRRFWQTWRRGRAGGPQVTGGDVHIRQALADLETTALAAYALVKSGGTWI
jgi:hypothetical protein